MSLVGYARVSSTDQDLTIQHEALSSAGCKKIFSEKSSGIQKEGRTQLEACLDYLREGDILVVTRIDRLSRSLRDLQNLMHDLKDNGVHLKVTEQPIDTSSAAGNAFFNMLGVFAEFETTLRKERQLEGIAKAKSEGKYKGRQPTARRKSFQVINLVKEGLTRQAIAEKLDIGVASVYRILKKYQEDNPTELLPGARSKLKIAKLDVYLRVENNSKFVRGKSKAREYIEDDWAYHYDMIKPDQKGCDYILKVPYRTMTELEDCVYEIMQEAHFNADIKNCFVEMSVTHKESGQYW
jgi:DNA invertase Pin-like site-specific DNA recombinase